MAAYDRKGIWGGIIAFGLWGILPVFLKLLSHLPPWEVLFHRMIWSFLFLVIYMAIKGKIRPFLTLLTNKRVMLRMALSSACIALNWLLYIYAISTNQVLEASLGYFMLPLVSVFMGVVFYKETLRPWQWTAVAAMIVAIALLMIQTGKVPAISLVLALSFGLYGLVRRPLGLDPIMGAALETTLMVIPATIGLFYCEYKGLGHWNSFDLSQKGLMVCTAATVLPFVFYGLALKYLSFSRLAIVQYLSPTIQFLLAYFLYKEPLSYAKLTSFIIIWIALFLYVWEERVTFQEQAKRKLEGDQAGYGALPGH